MPAFQLLSARLALQPRFSTNKQGLACWVFEQFRFDETARILELGCGSGSLTVRLAEAFPEATVIGIDFDPTMRALAQALADSR